VRVSIYGKYNCKQHAKGRTASAPQESRLCHHYGYTAERTIIIIAHATAFSTGTRYHTRHACFCQCMNTRPRSCIASCTTPSSFLLSPAGFRGLSSLFPRREHVRMIRTLRYLPDSAVDVTTQTWHGVSATALPILLPRDASTSFDSAQLS
jgi:hypothetical protein